MGIRAVIAGAILLTGCVSIPPLDDATFISVERVAKAPPVVSEPRPRVNELPLLRVTFSTARPLLVHGAGSVEGSVGFCDGKPFAEVDFLWQQQAVTKVVADRITQAAPGSPQLYEAFFRYFPVPISADPSVPLAVPPPSADLCLSVATWVNWPLGATHGKSLRIPQEAVAAALAQPAR